MIPRNIKLVNNDNDILFLETHNFVEIYPSPGAYADYKCKNCGIMLYENLTDEYILIEYYNMLKPLEKLTCNEYILQQVLL